MIIRRKNLVLLILYLFMFKKLSLLNAAEASVISFVIASLLGGSLLWFTESERQVQARVPMLEQVTVTPQDSIDPSGESYTQTHTFTLPTTYQGESFIDSLFTAVSALCVTGLTSTDFTQYTLSGQIITLILIQMGGLGIIVFTSLFAFAVVRGISDRTSFKGLLAGIMDTDHNDVSRMLKHVILYTFIFEGLATIIMGSYLQFFTDPKLINNLNPWWWALFHSVSAFNNAGFGLMNNNLMNFVTDPIISMTIAILIIVGGLGYPVLITIHTALRKAFFHPHDAKQKKLDDDIKGIVASPVQTKVAIWGTIVLLAFGTIFMMAVDWMNPAMTSLKPWEKLMASFFQSVSTRTAGFNTVDIGALHIATLIIFMFLMFVGANPAGTAGGIKIPTLAVLYGYIKDWFKKPGEPVMLFKKRISKFAVSHAMRLFFFSVLFILVITTSICVIEREYLITPDPTFNFTKVFFEVVSAFGTVGLSMGFAGGVTSFSAILASSSKFLIIVTMLFGRLGPLTWLAALPWKRKHADAPLSPDFENTEKIQIG